MAELRTSEEMAMIDRTRAGHGGNTMRITLLVTGLGLAMLWLMLALGVSPANAAIGDGVGIYKFQAVPSTTQAGGHPDLSLEFEIENRYDPQLKDSEDPTKFEPCACNDARDIIVNLPAGFIGNPSATPQCNAKEFAFDECPIDSQVGVATASGCLGATICSAVPNPTTNLIPPPTAAGLTGFKIPIFNAPVYTYLTARTGSDYGLRASVIGTERIFPVPHFIQNLWGVPADPIHDAQRFAKPCVLICEMRPPTTGYPSNSPLVPFLSNPTTCGEENLVTTIDITAYDHGRSHAEYPWPATTGCSQLDFNPSLAANPTTSGADTPSGIDVDLTVPQTLNPGTPSPSAIRGTKVKLPPGFTINPNAADGKTSCSDIQARFGTEDQAECSEIAKVGTLEIHSAVLPGVLPGAVYLGEPQPGNRYRLFLVADGFGLHVKLPGSVYPDPATGQITVSFQDLPQTPFERFNMHFFGSERGILATPTKCGTYAVESRFEPWNNALADQSSTQFFTIDSGPNETACPGATRPFAPTFRAASAGNTAGAHSPFAIELRRPDGDQNLNGLAVKTPPGFSGTLVGIPYCPEAAIAHLSNPLYSGVLEQVSPSCPAASQVGDAIAGAGAGSRPLYTGGKVYLAGPYKGAPLSLVVVIPAVSGPYDLGNVAVRAAIQVNPSNAQVTTVSDPLPQILEGIPLRARAIMVDLNRPGFARNPTNCNPLSVEASVEGSEGAVATPSSHYQVANCATLSFEPELKLRLTGGMKRTGHPALTATLTTQPGEANLSRSEVALPPTVLLDNAHIGTICTRVQFAADTCPPDSVYGSAIAYTPQLDQPLQGPVYLRASSNKLPDLVADLRGQIDIELVGRVDSIKGGIRTTFEGVPDASVSKFVLSLKGGDKGLLFNSSNLCRVRKRAKVRSVGQNGMRHNVRISLNPSCGKGRKKQRLFRATEAGR
jgi:hypothetical protein